MATSRRIKAITDRLRGQTLTHEQADEIRMHLTSCTATQPRRRSYGIKLTYPTGPVVAFEYDTREQAQQHIDDVLDKLVDGIDPRWANAEAVEIV